MFAPIGTISNTNYNTYYSDAANVLTSRLARAGGNWSSSAQAGVFLLYVTANTSTSGASYGTRLMYL
jgi:hypothetical protein